MKYILITTSLITMLLLSSCIKEEILPPQPQIKVLDFISYSSDSAECIISFEDGDGDIGNFEGDTKKNMFLYYYAKDKATGEFVMGDGDKDTPKIDTVLFDYTIYNLTPKGSNKTLKGEIKAKISTVYYNPFDESYKYFIYITDRAGNISNKVFTNENKIP